MVWIQISGEFQNIFDTLTVFLIFFGEKVDFEKKSQQRIKIKTFTQHAKSLLSLSFLNSLHTGKTSWIQTVVNYDGTCIPKMNFFKNIFFKAKKQAKLPSIQRVKVSIQRTKIFKYCTCPAGRVTYNFHSSCKHMHVF